MTVEMTSVADLQATRGGAKAYLLTVLGEFVLPAGGSAWTSTLLASAGTLGIGEKNARQAIARVGDHGLIESTRHGRNVRWELTAGGRELMEDGTERIYRFGTAPTGWDGRWLVAHCPVPEQHRPLRRRLRTKLGFLGFGELSANLLISPHLDREPELRRVLGGLDLAGDSTVMISTVESPAEQADLVARAWDLTELAAAYREFEQTYHRVTPCGPEQTFAALVGLVNDWRRFPSIDPELPLSLLPANWAGTTALELFRQRHGQWSATARQWFGSLEASGRHTD